MEKNIQAEHIPEMNDDNKYDLKFFDSEVTNMSAKESFINDEEKEKILSKIHVYEEKFKEI